MIRVLFVCHGNICRSPMAEFMLKDKVMRQGIADSFHIESAATTSEEIWGGRGNPVYPRAREVLRNHGIDCSNKRARLMTRGDFDRFDYLIGMDFANIRSMERISGHPGSGKIRLMMSFAGEERSVADPWYTDDFETAYIDINKGLNGFLAALRADRRI